jgi:hypothetical protein
MHSKIDHIMIGKRWHLSVGGVQSFRGAACDTDHFLVMAKVGEQCKILTCKDFISKS